MVDLIVTVVSWVENVVGWFKKLKLDKKRHIPLIIDMKTLRKQLDNAPVIEGSGVFEAVYDEQTDEMVAHNTIKANSLDRKTQDALNQGGGMVVLG
ncbi:MAG: hypothetical protein MR215_00730 [Bacteroidales bacterium]|nr:hypothetical protein [Bacteroidales bacterium]